jgi:hypothetical protein
MKIGLINVPNWVLYTAAAGVVLYVIKKGSIQAAAADAVATVVGTAGDVVTGTASGVVLGVGDIVGLPRTNLQACQLAISQADNAKASQYCSAGVFAKWQYLSIKKKVLGIDFTMSDIFN